MTPPRPDQLFDVLDATWPPARWIRTGPWCLREGKGGGQRVSAATAKFPVSETDIALAETGMRGIGQDPIFMIRPWDTGLDRWLDTRRYRVVDPVTVYAAPAKILAGEQPITAATPTWPPLAVQSELWQAGGIGPARIAVMERAKTVKTAILGRSGDTPAGVAYVAAKDGVAMLHALEVAPAMRRTGVASAILKGAANWALGKRADWLAVLVTKANGPGNALYRHLAMTPVTDYHYRRMGEALA